MINAKNLCINNIVTAFGLTFTGISIFFLATGTAVFAISLLNSGILLKQSLSQVLSIPGKLFRMKPMFQLVLFLFLPEAFAIQFHYTNSIN